MPIVLPAKIDCMVLLFGVSILIKRDSVILVSKSIVSLKVGLGKYIDFPDVEATPFIFKTRSLIEHLSRPVC